MLGLILALVKIVTIVGIIALFIAVINYTLENPYEFLRSVAKTVKKVVKVILKVK